MAFEMRSFFTNARTRLIRPIRQFCEEEITVADGPYRGKPFRVARQPAIGLWFDEINSNRWNELFFTAPSQWGKTLVAFIAPAIYHTAEMRENYVLAVPDMNMGQNKWQVDLKPAYEASPTLRKLLPASGEGSRGGKIQDSVTLNNGSMIKWMTAGGDDTQKAGFTARIVGVTEAARFSASSETSVEADPLRQLEARQRAYKTDQRRLYVEGTVTIEDELPWRAFDRSSQSRILTPCPHCESWIAPEREHLCGWEEAESEIEAGELSCWYCYQCGEIITDEQRLSVVGDCKIIHGDQTINERGEIVGDLPKTKRLFFRATPWLNKLLSTADIGVDEWKAAQIDEDSPDKENEEKRLSQFVWCLPYIPKNTQDIEIDRDKAQRRTLASHPRGVVPDDTVTLTVGTDCGKWEVHWVCLAIREGGFRHVVDYGVVDVPSKSMPEEEAILEALIELRDTVKDGWQLASGEIRNVDAWWIDAGYKGRIIEAFCKSERERTGKSQWAMASRGIGESKAHTRRYLAPKKTGNEVRQVDPKGRWHVSWIPISRVYGVEWDADAGKLAIQNGLVIETHKPGSITLFQAPSRTHRKLIRHCTNERKVVETKPLKGDVLVWKRTGANHWLDSLAEADTAAGYVEYTRERKRKAEENAAKSDNNVTE